MLRGPSTPACRRNEIRTARPAREASGSPVRNRYLLPSSRPKGQLRPKSVSSALSTAECPEIRRMPVPPQPPHSTRRPATPPTKVAQSHSATPEPHPSAERIAQVAMRATLIDSDSVRGTLTTHHQPTPTRDAPNAALGASHAPNATLGASHAPNATLGRRPPPPPNPHRCTQRARHPAPPPTPIRSSPAVWGCLSRHLSRLDKHPQTVSTIKLRGAPRNHSGRNVAARRRAARGPHMKTIHPTPSRTPSNIHPRYHPIWGIPPPVDLGNRPKRS